MDLLEKQGLFEKPSVDSLEEPLLDGISLGALYVFAHTCDPKFFSKCEQCIDARSSRIAETNLHQKLLEKVSCYY